MYIRKRRVSNLPSSMKRFSGGITKFRLIGNRLDRREVETLLFGYLRHGGRFHVDHIRAVLAQQLCFSAASLTSCEVASTQSPPSSR